VVIASPADEASVAPSEKVAGVGLALRAVLTLQSCGVDAIALRGPEPLRAELAADPRVTVDLEAQRGPLSDRTLVTRFDQIVAPAVFDQLLATEEGRVAIVSEGGVGPAVLLASDEAALPTLEAEDVRWLEPAGFVHDATEAAGRRAATRALFEACRKPIDGIVSRHLNRHVSLWLSRRLVDTPITPNAMTAVTFAVSIIASGLALEGSHASFAVAGVLMQLNSILDGCDGELARVRFQGSQLGQWLDTIGDDLSNVLFWVAVAYGARTVSTWGPWLERAGLLAAGANGLSALINYAVLAQKGSGDFYVLMEDGGEPGGVRRSIVDFFSTVLRQDFFLFAVMVVAVIGWLPWVLPVIAAGAVITLGASTVRAARFFRRRALQPNRR